MVSRYQVVYCILWPTGKRTTREHSKSCRLYSAQAAPENSWVGIRDPESGIRRLGGKKRGWDGNPHFNFNLLGPFPEQNSIHRFSLVYCVFHDSSSVLPDPQVKCENDGNCENGDRCHEWGKNRFKQEASPHVDFDAETTLL